MTTLEVHGFCEYDKNTAYFGSPITSRGKYNSDSKKKNNSKTSLL